MFLTLTCNSNEHHIFVSKCRIFNDIMSGTWAIQLCQNTQTVSTFFSPANPTSFFLFTSKCFCCTNLLPFFQAYPIFISMTAIKYLVITHLSIEDTLFLCEIIVFQAENILHFDCLHVM